MFHKIVRLNNIKQLNHSSPPEHDFGLLNLIYGNNGSGKSTVCKILNLLNEKDSSLLDKLKSIECSASDNVDFNFYLWKMKNRSLSPAKI